MNNVTRDWVLARHKPLVDEIAADPYLYAGKLGHVPFTPEFDKAVAVLTKQVTPAYQSLILAAFGHWDKKTAKTQHGLPPKTIEDAFAEFLWTATVYDFRLDEVDVRKAYGSGSSWDTNWATGDWFRYGQLEWLGSTWYTVPALPAPMLAMAGYKLASTWRYCGDMTREERKHLYELMEQSHTLKGAIRRLVNQYAQDDASDDEWAAKRDRAMELVYEHDNGEELEAELDRVEIELSEELGRCAYGGELPIFDIDADDPKGCETEEELDAARLQNREDAATYAAGVSKLWKEWTGASLMWFATSLKGGLHGRTPVCSPALRHPYLLLAIEQYLGEHIGEFGVSFQKGAEVDGRAVQVNLDRVMFHHFADSRGGMWRLPGCKKDKPGSLPQTPVIDTLDQFPEFGGITSHWTVPDAAATLELVKLADDLRINEEGEALIRGYAAKDEHGKVKRIRNASTTQADATLGDPELPTITALLVDMSNKVGAGHKRHDIRLGVMGWFCRLGIPITAIGRTLWALGKDAVFVRDQMRKTEDGLRRGTQVGNVNLIAETVSGKDYSDHATRDVRRELEDALAADVSKAREAAIASGAYVPPEPGQPAVEGHQHSVGCAHVHTPRRLARKNGKFSLPPKAERTKEPGSAEVKAGEKINIHKAHVWCPACDKWFDQTHERHSAGICLDSGVKVVTPRTKAQREAEAAKAAVEAEKKAEATKAEREKREPEIAAAWAADQAKPPKRKAEPKNEDDEQTPKGKGPPKKQKRKKKPKVGTWAENLHEAILANELANPQIEPGEDRDRAWLQKFERAMPKSSSKTAPIFERTINTLNDMVANMGGSDESKRSRKSLLIAVLGQHLAMSGLDPFAVQRIGDRTKMPSIFREYESWVEKFKKWKRTNERWTSVIPWEAASAMSPIGDQKNWTRTEVNLLRAALVDDMDEHGCPAWSRLLVQGPGGSWTNHDRMTFEQLVASAHRAKERGETITADEEKALKILLETGRCGATRLDRRCERHDVVSSSPISCNKELACPRCREKILSFIPPWIRDIGGWPDFVYSGVFEIADDVVVKAQQPTDVTYVDKKKVTRRRVAMKPVTDQVERALKGFRSSPDFKLLKKHMGGKHRQWKYAIRYWYAGGKKVLYALSTNYIHPDGRNVDDDGEPFDITHVLRELDVFRDAKLIPSADFAERLILTRWRTASEFDEFVAKVTREAKQASMGLGGLEWADMDAAIAVYDKSWRKALSMGTIRAGLFRTHFTKTCNEVTITDPTTGETTLRGGMLPWFDSAQMWAIIRDAAAKERGEDFPKIDECPMWVEGFNENNVFVNDYCRKPLTKEAVHEDTGYVLERSNVPGKTIRRETVWERLDKLKLPCGTPKTKKDFEPRAVRHRNTA